MPEEYKQLVIESIVDQANAINPNFIQATISGSRPGASAPWKKVVLRPINLKGVLHVQFSQYDDRKCIAKNYEGADLSKQLVELLDAPYRNFHLSTASEEIQINIAKSGKAIYHSSKSAKAVTQVDLSHNRQKDLVLPEGTPNAYLQAIGFMTQDGQIRADRQKKFKQTNEFLKFIQQTGEIERIDKPILEVVDFGCGNAYLTFAVYHYLNDMLRRPTHLVGVDLQGDLLEKHARTVEVLGWEGIRFEKNSIANWIAITPPDVVIALHACDTATDEALSQGIAARAQLIISVPCCHHDLQVQLANSATPDAFRAVSRHGILMERTADILTDAFRALILRIMGYQAEVIQFIAVEHTAKNLMIRAVNRNAPATPKLVEEYESMKTFWGVTPHLEKLLGDSLQKAIDAAKSAGVAR